MKILNFKIIIASYMTLAVFSNILALPVIVNAETSQANSDYTLLAPLPSISSTDGTPTLQTKINFQDYIGYAFNLFIAIAAVAAVVMIIYGGFQYMMSSIPSVKSDGISNVKNAIFGLVMVLCSFLILRTINPKLVDVPETLVPPLGLKVSNQISALMDQLQNEASQFNDQVGADTDKINVALDSLKGLKTKLSDLETQYEQALYNYDEDAVNKISAQIADVQGQIASTTADVAVNSHHSVTITIIADTTNDMFQASGPKAVQQIASARIARIASLTDDRVKQLESIGAVDRIAIVKSQGKYAIAMINIQDAVAEVDKSPQSYWSNQPKIKEESIQKINQVVADYAALPYANPDLLAQLKVKAQDTIKIIGNTNYTNAH